MSQPEMMKPKCGLCEQEFTPGPLAMVGLTGRLIDEHGAHVKNINFNICDRCSVKLQDELARFKKIQAALMN